jgi:hypothetical protein
VITTTPLGRYREALVTKALLKKLSQTMNEVIRVVNYIKSNSHRTSIFASLCETMDSEFRSQRLAVSYWSEMTLKRKSSWTSDIFAGRSRHIFRHSRLQIDSTFFMMIFGGLKFCFWMTFSINWTYWIWAIKERRKTLSPSRENTRHLKKNCNFKTINLLDFPS